MSTKAITTPVIVLAVMLLIAAAAVAVYFLIYKKLINRRLEQGGSVTPLPAPRSMAVTIAAMVCAACLIGMFLLMIGIKKDVSAVTSRLMSELDTLKGDVSALDAEFNRKLEQAASPFKSFDYTASKVDIPSHLITLNIIAVPKQDMDDNLHIELDGHIYDLVYNGAGAYTCTADVDTAKGMYLSDCTISEGAYYSAVWSTSIDLLRLIEGYVPVVSFNQTSDPVFNYNSSKNEYSANLSGRLFISYYTGKISNVCLIARGGSEQKKDITSEFRDTEGGIEAYIDLNGKYKADDNGRLSFTIELTDQSGLIYSRELTTVKGNQGFTVNENGSATYYLSGNGTLTITNGNSEILVP